DLRLQLGLYVAEFGVGLAAGYATEVHVDEVVRVALRLRATGERLSGVGDEARVLLLLSGKGVHRLEADLLHRELVVHVVLGEVRVARQNKSGDEQEAGQDSQSTADDEVQGPTLHCYQLHWFVVEVSVARCALGGQGCKSAIGRDLRPDAAGTTGGV